MGLDRIKIAPPPQVTNATVKDASGTQSKLIMKISALALVMRAWLCKRHADSSTCRRSLRYYSSEYLNLRTARFQSGAHKLIAARAQGGQLGEGR